MDLIDQVAAVRSLGAICDHCLGRFFGRLSSGLSNDERGKALRITHSMRENVSLTAEGNPCWICGDLFAGIPLWVSRMTDAVVGVEFSTFVVGCRIPPLMAEAEEMVWSDLALSGAEPLKSEVNREAGKLFSARTGAIADLQRPDVVFFLDLAEGTVSVTIRPLFIRGRYRKWERGIPQTHWDCRKCRGKGCPACGFTGKQYRDSVEELIGRPLIPVFEAGGVTLHGAGREDIDARMVGSGRPFILEIGSPRRRTADLQEVEALVNASAAGRVDVTIERWATRDEVETLKSHRWQKKYRILVEIEDPPTEQELLTAISALCGASIHQRTPQRVAHRRADLVRRRRVLDIVYAGLEDGKFLIEVTGDAGLYIKELVSGDEGRTYPSLSGILARPARVTCLDVVAVLTEEESSDGTSQWNTKKNTV